MSDDPMGEALQRIVGKGMMTGYYVVGEFINEDGKRCWLADYPTEQSLSYSIGLLEWGRLTLKAEAQEYFDRLALAAMDDEDEDDE
jgi:hypothetical protein